MKFDGNKIPKKVNYCPIVEAIAELYFVSDLPSDAIIGIILKEFNDTYTEFEKLPIMELPSFIRDNEPKLIYAPHYRIKSENFILQIGSKSLSVAHKKDYQGWNKYHNEIKNVLEKLNTLKFIKEVTRSGLRYINFFENRKILQDLQLTINLADNDLSGLNTLLRSEFEYKNYKCVVQVANNALYDSVKNGSSIDIDVIHEKSEENLLNLVNIFEKAHDVERNVFFNVLSNDFLNSLVPEYEV